MSNNTPTFDEFVRPLLGDSATDGTSAADTPLSALKAGDYAVLAWLDAIQARFPAYVEADVIAQWDTASLRDVYTMLYPDAEADTQGVHT